MFIVMLMVYCGSGVMNAGTIVPGVQYKRRDNRLKGRAPALLFFLKLELRWSVATILGAVLAK